MLGAAATVAGALATGLMTPTPAPAQVEAVPAAAADLLETQLTTLRNPQADPNLRVQAARMLLESGRKQALSQFRVELATTPDPVELQAMLLAISVSPVPPSRDRDVDLAPILLDLLTTARDATLAELTAALGRYNDPATLASLTTLAVDGRRTVNLRVTAVAILAQQRTKPVAATLMALIAPAQPAPVRSAAFDALRRLTGLEYGLDEGRWQQWWAENRAADPQEWSQRLFENFAQGRDRLSLQVRQLQDRLVESQRAIYRSSAPDRRPELLVAMLADPMDAIRQLGVNLCELALSEDGPAALTAPVRATLLQAMDGDPLSDLRQRATLLLRALAEEKAADKAAAILVLGQEQRPELERAYLLLLASMPRPAAVGPAVRLLENPDLRREAAECLTVAADRPNFISARQREEALTIVRTLLAAGDGPGGGGGGGGAGGTGGKPEPTLITLLGRLGREQDWEHIRAWLDDRDPAVQDAAVRAWAHSDRPLTALLERGRDPVVYPVLLDAAVARGSGPALLDFVVRNPPDPAGNAAALQGVWAQALAAVAGRNDLSAALGADNWLQDHQGATDLRQRLLTAAWDHWTAAHPAGANAVAPDAQGVTLLLRRARLYLEDNNPRAAVADALLARRAADPATPARRSAALLALRARLALSDIEEKEIEALIREALGPPLPPPPPPPPPPAATQPGATMAATAPAPATQPATAPVTLPAATGPAPAPAPVAAPVVPASTTAPASTRPVYDAAQVAQVCALVIPAAERALPDRSERARDLLTILVRVLQGPPPAPFLASYTALEQKVGPIALPAPTAPPTPAPAPVSRPSIPAPPAAETAPTTP